MLTVHRAALSMGLSPAIRVGALRRPPTLFVERHAVDSGYSTHELRLREGALSGSTQALARAIMDAYASEYEGISFELVSAPLGLRIQADDQLGNSECMKWSYIAEITTAFGRLMTSESLADTFSLNDSWSKRWIAL